MKKQLRWIAGILIGALFLAGSLTGCRPASQDEESTPVTTIPESNEIIDSVPPEEETAPEAEEPGDVPEGEPTFGGKLVVSTVMVDNYNPLLVKDQNTANVLSLIFSPLLDIDASGRIHPSIASKWELSEDNLTAVLTINPDAWWQNGEKVNAGDVVFSVRTIQQQEACCYKESISNIKDVGVLTDDQVQFWFNEASPLNLNQLYFPIISQDYYVDLHHELEPMGCGPYYLDEYVTKDRFVLKADPDYFGQPPYIDTAEILLERSDACKDSFDHGITNLYYMKDIVWKNYTNRVNVNLHLFTTSEMEMLTFNVKKVPDVNLRKAVAYALDAQRILRSTNIDKGEISESPISPSRWYGPTNQSLYGFSTDKMAELLDLSETTTLTLLVNTEDRLQKDVGEEVSAELTDQGFEINLKAMPKPAYENALQNGAFDIALETVTIDNDRDLKLFFMDYRNNHSGYVSDAMTALINRIPLQIEETAIHQCFVDVAGQLAQDLPNYCLFFKKQAVMTGAGVYGSLEPTEYNVYRGISNLYMVTK